LALLLTLLDRHLTQKKLSITVPLVALGVAVLATAAQLVPLPARLVAWLSPAAHETFSTLPEYSWHALSLDPPGTAAELAKLLAYAAFFQCAATYATRTHRRRQIVLAVVGAGVLVALIGLVQAVAGSSRILFFYEPHHQILNEILVRGTFVNPNHFGALLCLSAPCALALGLREPGLRWPAFLAAIVINVALVLSLSRSGIIAGLLGQALTFGLDRWKLHRGSRSESSWKRSVALVLAVTLAVVLASALGAKRLASALRTTQDVELSAPLSHPASKFHTWKASAALIWQYPWTGVGRGAFAQAFTPASEQGAQVRYRYAENGYLQVLTDFGVPVGLLLYVLAGWALLVAIKRLAEDPLVLGALAAILALAVHEAADFSIELPGVGLPALALLATLFARRSSEPEGGRRRIPMRAWFFFAPCAVALGALFALVLPSAEADAASLARTVRDAMTPINNVLEEVEILRRRLPADYLIPLLVAERLARESHDQTMTWLGDATFLNPHHPTPHLMTAELLIQSGRKSQALLEYRTAARTTVYLDAIWARVSALFPDLDDLVSATPDHPRRLEELAHWLATHERASDAETLYLKLQERDPTKASVLEALVRLAQERADLALARHRAQELLSLAPTDRAKRLAARVLIAADELDSAAQTLDTVMDRSADSLAVEIELAVALGRKGEHSRARTRLTRLSATMDRSFQIKLHETKAEIERLAGNEHQSRWELEQASRLRVP
jgi:Tfp pilus assembly protein PilF